MQKNTLCDMQERTLRDRTLFFQMCDRTLFDFSIL